MKKARALQILIIALLISLSIFAFISMQAKADPLDHFAFNAISSPQTAGVSFNVTITAQDSSNDTVTSYSGTPSLSDLSGTISPLITSAFVNGVWTGSVTVTAASSDSITVTDGEITGTSNSFTVNPVITVTQMGNGTIAPGTITVNYGDNQNFTVTPNTGNYIASITTDSGSVAVSSLSGQTVNFANVQADHTLTATYAPNNYTLTIHINGQGSVTPGNGTYPYNTEVTLQESSAAGWSFGGWSTDGTSSNITVTMSSNQTVTATFTENPQTTPTPTPTQTPTTATTPTATPAPTPAPTFTPTPTTTSTSKTQPSQSTPTLTLATMGQYLPIIAAAIILGAVVVGVVIRRRKSPTIIILN